MIRHEIELSSFLRKGQVDIEYKEDLLYMRTNDSLPSKRFNAQHLSINSYIYLPDKYKLPLRVDLTVKIDAPGLYILLGEGHINFGTLCSDNRRMDDIVKPSRKTMQFDNSLEMNQFTNISLLYDLKEMQILVDGKERYYSKKEKYMKSPDFLKKNRNGFEFKLTCDKLVNTYIKSIYITEYLEGCDIIHSNEDLPLPRIRNEGVALGEKPRFEQCISLLPKVIQDEIIKTEQFLKSCRKLKFKRVLEKNGAKITYVSSDYGMSYAIYLSNEIFDHSIQWYLITKGKPETWHRKADYMEEILANIQDSSPGFAARLFHSFEDCVGCYQNCLAKTQYQLEDKKKIVCHGKLKFKMSESGFEDVRTFINEVNNLNLENLTC